MNSAARLMFSSSLHDSITPLPRRLHWLKVRERIDFKFALLVCTPVLHPGTRCLTISRTLIYPFKLSNIILRHSSFPHTSTFSTFEVSYETRYINLLLLLNASTEQHRGTFPTNLASRQTSTLDIVYVPPLHCPPYTRLPTIGDRGYNEVSRTVCFSRLNMSLLHYHCLSSAAASKCTSLSK